MTDKIAPRPGKSRELRNLSPDQWNHYKRDGIVFPVSVLSASEADAFRRSLESLAVRHLGGLYGRIANLHRFFFWAFRLATTPSLLDAVEDIIGQDILIDGTIFFNKAPGDRSYASWHQDSVYSQWHLTPTVSAWIALTPSHASNGCMRVIPGSHADGLFDHDTVCDENNLLRRGERVAIQVEEERAENVELRPGQMSLHHCNVIHGSRPNESDEARIGFIVRYVTPRVTTHDHPCLRARGDGDCRHLSLAPSPDESVPVRDAVAAWRSSESPR